MPRYAADRVLLAPLADVWAFLSEPYNLADWFPGVSGIEPDRRGLAPGARWKVIGPNEPSYFRRPQATGTLLIVDVVPQERIAFELTGDRISADLTLRAVDVDRTEASLLVDGPWLIGLRRSFPRLALDRLHSLLRTGEEI
ncbi:MAG: SRPBCC family protein [Actinomycetota bacterium]